MMGINKTLSSAFQSQGNGMAERYVRSLKEKIRNLIQEKEQDWDDLIDLSLMSLRTCYHEATKVCPFELVYGRLPKTFNSIKIVDETKEMNLHIAAEKLAKSIIELEKKSKHNIEKSQNKYKHYANIDITEVSFKPGDLVRIRKEINPSLAARCGPPVKIINEQIPGTYLIEGSDWKKMAVHHDRLKLYQSSENYNKKQNVK